jgi:hypothetical protein
MTGYIISGKEYFWTGKTWTRFIELARVYKTRRAAQKVVKSNDPFWSSLKPNVQALVN